MKEIVLLKYGELALKGTNRSTFESILIKNIRRRLRDLGEFSIVKAQSTITVAPKADGVDMDENNRITVIVTDNEQIPQSGMTIIVKSDLGRKETGLTDENGKLTVPAIADIEEHTAYLYGYPDGTFRPNDKISRADICTIVFRAAKDKLTKNEEASKFTDDIRIPDYSREAVYALVSSGIVNGYEGGYSAPEKLATRAQTAKIIYSTFIKK